MEQDPVNATPAVAIEAIRSAHEGEIERLEKIHAQALQKCRDEMSAKTENFETLCGDLTRLQEENGVLRGQHDTLENIIAAHQREVGNIMREIWLESTEQHLSSLKDVCSRIETAVDKYSGNITTTQEFFLEMWQKEAREAKGSREEAWSLKWRLEAAERQSKHLEDRANYVEENYNHYRDRYMDGLREVAANAEKVRDCDRIATEHHSLQESVKDYEKQIREFRQTEKDLRAHLSKVESSERVLKTDNTRLKEAETRLQKEISRVSAQLSNVEFSENTLKANNIRLKDAETTLREENAKLKAQLEECLERQRASSIVTVAVPQSASQPSGAITTPQAIQRTSETQSSQGRLRNTMRSNVNATHRFGDVVSRKVLGREHFTPSDTADLHDDVKK